MALSLPNSTIYVEDPQNLHRLKPTEVDYTALERYIEKIPPNRETPDWVLKACTSGTLAHCPDHIAAKLPTKLKAATKLLERPIGQWDELPAPFKEAILNIGGDNLPLPYAAIRLFLQGIINRIPVQEAENLVGNNPTLLKEILQGNAQNFETETFPYNGILFGISKKCQIASYHEVRDQLQELYEVTNSRNNANKTPRRLELLQELKKILIELSQTYVRAHAKAPIK